MRVFQLALFLLLLLLELQTSSAWIARAASAFILASSADLSRVFDSTWLSEPPSTTFSKQDVLRLDEISDDVFYANPRFVEHIDAAAVQALTVFHDALLRDQQQQQQQQQQRDGKLKVLDLCSSWVSHVSLPGALDWIDATGLGMNAAELERNPLLSQRVVQDLNKQPILPFADGTFDVVLLQLSFDYLTRPVEVMREVSRVLRPGSGTVAVTFSNRVFIDKVVGYWSGAPDEEHAEAVGDALRAAGGFVMPPKALDLKEGRGGARGDPLFAVTAQRAVAGEAAEL